MGWFSGLRRSFAKSAELRRISKQLGGPPPTNPMALMQQAGAEEDALSKLWDLVEGDPDLARILRTHEADRARLNKLMRHLRVVGAGTWAGGHYVPASTFAFGPTLDYVLRHTGSADLSRADMLEVAYRLTAYFQRGGTGLVR